MVRRRSHAHPDRVVLMAIDYEGLANSVEEMREIFRAMVAGLVADGFTEEQARALVVEITTRQVEEDGDE